MAGFLVLLELIFVLSYLPSVACDHYVSVHLAIAFENLVVMDVRSCRKVPFHATPSR